MGAAAHVRARLPAGLRGLKRNLCQRDFRHALLIEHEAKQSCWDWSSRATKSFRTEVLANQALTVGAK